MSDYEVVSRRLEWERQAQEGYVWWPVELELMDEYRVRRLDPTYKLPLETERLLAHIYGLVTNWGDVSGWIEELEATAKDREDE